MAPEINEYVNKRYIYWRDYARFHTVLAKIPGMANDLLHVVLLNLLEKPEKQVLDLYQRVKAPYRELDYFILKMIKLNAHSKNSPFRYYYSYERIPIDTNTDPWQSRLCLNISDMDYDPESDDQFANGFLSDLRLLRIAIEKTDLSPDEKTMTEWTLLNNEQIKFNPYLEGGQSVKYKVFNSGKQKVVETYQKLKYHG